MLHAALTALLALTLLWARPALAEGSVPSEVFVVLASTEGSGIDRELEALEALKKPPFDTFTKKTLIKRATLKLDFGKEAELELPNGRKLKLVLIERLKDGRFRCNISINKPAQRDYLPAMTVVAAPGDPFFVAGQKHEGGTLVIGVRVGK